MILSDQSSASIFKTQGLNMKGDRLVTGEDSVFKYYIRISEEIHVTGDPKFSCTEYHQPGAYHSCLEVRTGQIFLQIVSEGNLTFGSKTMMIFFTCESNSRSSRP